MGARAARAPSGGPSPGARRRRCVPRRGRQGGPPCAAVALDRGCAPASPSCSRSAATGSPPACTLRPASYLAHRRPPERPGPHQALRPRRFLPGAPEPGTYLPFGGGVRRCAGAAFAVLELREVLRAVLARFALAPAGDGTERMRRGSVTLRPSRGGTRRARSRYNQRGRVALLPPQPPDRQLPDLHPASSRPSCGPRCRLRARRAPARASGSTAKRRSGSTRRTSGVVTRRIARPADDGYRCPLAPGLRATADAERLAAALAPPPSGWSRPARTPRWPSRADLEEAIWLAFLLALAGPDKPELRAALLGARPALAGRRPAVRPEEEPTHRRRLPRVGRRAPGSQAAAHRRRRVWTPERHFARLFDRLALPGFGRAARYSSSPLGAAGLYELEADALHVAVAHDDATTLAAKRALSSGDAMLLERRARRAGRGGHQRADRGAGPRPGAVGPADAQLDARRTSRLDPIRAALRLRGEYWDPPHSTPSTTATAPPPRRAPARRSLREWRPGLIGSDTIHPRAARDRRAELFTRGPATRLRILGDRGRRLPRLRARGRPPSTSASSS